MTTYYVATSGNDSGTGSATSPWRTINKAMPANLKPGDEVVCGPGRTTNQSMSKDGRLPATSRCAPRFPARR